MVNRASFQAIIHGHVQGVFFRAFILEKATELGLTGFARNLPSGRDIEIQAEGDRDKLERLIEQLRSGPPSARVEEVTIKWSGYSNKYSNFKIRY